MSGTGPAAASPLARAVVERALSPSDDPALDGAVRRLAEAAGDSLVGLVFFGSRRTGAARKDAWSAYDLFVVVAGYRPFYESLHRAGLTGKRPALMALVSGWLPPTQYSMRFDDLGVHVKASVLRSDRYARETSARRRDHFCIGRLFQPTRVLHARDDAARQGILDGLTEAVRQTWAWSRPWLPGTFDADAYGRSALRTSMRWEVRPEPAGRADALWEAQKAVQLPVLEALLGELAARGELAPAPGAPRSWTPTRPVGAVERLRLELYFRRSIVRSTTRWLKHVVTFEGWLDYLVRKAGRHTGAPIELTKRERRFPLVFLWGRVFAYLRNKNRDGRPR
jgi:predicted nucleotidyltransferase